MDYSREDRIGKPTPDAPIGSGFVILPFKRFIDFWNDDAFKVLEWKVFSPSGLVPDKNIEEVTYVAVRFTGPAADSKEN